jgi:nucleoid-associated protein YgaU
MLRATLIAAGFVAITLALILIQPGKPRPVADLPPLSGNDVTRTATDLSALNPTAPASDPLVNSAALATQPALPAPALPTAPQIPAAMPVGPAGLVTAEGRVDTALLLSALSQPARPRVPNTYTVATGDSLASIAYRFYGDFARQADILAANADTMQATDRLRVGQVLNLPTP